MAGNEKSKAELIRENEALRRRVAELESGRAAGECREASDAPWSDCDPVSFVDNAPVGVIIQRADGSIQFWNRMGRDLFDAPQPEVSASSAVVGAWTVTHPDGTAWPAGEHPSMRTLRTGQPLRNETMRLVRPGGERWLSINTEPVFGGSGGKPVAVIVTFLDITEQVLADEALAHKDALLQAMVRNLPFDFWARDLDQNVVIQSDASVRLWGDLGSVGIEESEVVPEVLEAWKSSNARAYAGEVVSSEERYTVPSGEDRIYRCIVAPIRRNGDVLGILGTNIDLTDYTRNQEALHRSEANLSSLINAIEESVVLFRPDGTIISANHTFAERRGVTVPGCLGGSVFGWLPDDVAQRTRSYVEQVLKERRSMVFEDARLGRWVRQKLTPVVAADGSVAAIAVFGVDLTERKRREDLLVARQRLSEYAINHPLKELLRMALDEAEAVTGSVLSFLHFLNEDQRTLSMQAWSTRTLRTGFRSASLELHYELGRAGVWADCVRERKPVIHNDYSSLPHRKGVPSGHPALTRQLLLPVVRADRIVAILAVANKPSDYAAEDVQTLSELGNLLWDIIEYKRTHEELRKSETLLNMTQSLSRIGGWEWDLERQTMSWTREMYRLHGFSADDFGLDSSAHIARSLACYRPEDRQTVEAAFRDCVSRGIPYDIEMPFTSADGQQMLVRSRGEAVWDNGRVVKVFGIFMDITARRSLEHRYRTLFRNMTDGFALHEMICDAEGRPQDYRFLDVNPAFERHTGLAAADAVGRTVREIMPGIEPVWIDTYGRVALTGEPAFFEEYTGNLGKYFEVSAFRPAPMQFACIFSDITDRKKYELALRQAKTDAEAASLAKSEFLANMSHEIRTPLNGVLGILQLFQSFELTAEHRKLVQLAASSAERLTMLLSDLLDLSKIESGKLVVAERPFAPLELRDATLGVFAVAADGKGLSLDFSLDPALPEILLGDDSRLRQILFNLVGNAVKFTSAGFVRVEVLPLPVPRPCVLFCVGDSGPGISEERLDDIFKPFVQGEDSYVRQHQGAGLGLAIVKRLIGLMGGSLCVDSGPGGTTICFSLPLRTGGPSPQEQLQSAMMSMPAGGLRILLVEDDMVSMYAASRVLEKAGHEVVTATDGAQALERLREADFDLVLMDVQLPVMDGVQATARIRADQSLGARAGVPIIAMTAYAMGGDREKFLAAGMDGYIPKPFSIGELFRALDAVGLFPKRRSARGADDDA